MSKRMTKSRISRRSVHHFMNTYLLLTIILIFSVQQVLSQWDMYLTCPVDWYDGKSVNLICEVSKNSLTAKCGNTPQSAGFYVNTGSGNQRKSIVNSTTISNCQVDSSGSGCQSNSTFYIFYYKFSADKSAAGNWTCQVVCFQSGSPVILELDSANCINVQVKESNTGETTSGGTSTGGTSTVFADGTSTDNLTPGKKAGIAIGVIVGIAIIITIILVIYHYACGHELCGKQGYTPCCRPAGKGKKENSNVQRTEKHLSEAHPMRHPE